MHCEPPPGVTKPVASLFQGINGVRTGADQLLLKVFTDAEWHYHLDQPRPV